MKDYILIAGDFVPEDIAAKSGAKVPYCEKLQAEVEAASHFIVNLEAPITGSKVAAPKSGPNLKLSDFDLDKFAHFGITGVKLANNHMMDFGAQGLKDTISACEQGGIQYCGAGMNKQDAQRTLKIEFAGKRVGLINVCENEFGVANSDAAGVNGYNLPSLIRQLAQAKSQYDYVIVAFHCGVEHLAIPRPRLVDECRLLAELGADLIICHHTHTPSAYEIHAECQIFYGIGNFYFPGTKSNLMWNRGLIVKVTISENNKLAGELIYTRQGNTSICVEKLSGVAEQELTEFLEEQNQIVASNGWLNEKWVHYCSEVENEFLNLVYFPLIAWPMRVLSAFSIFRRIAFPFYRVAVRKNLITCESHYEVLQTIHSSYYNKIKAPENDKK